MSMVRHVAVERTRAAGASNRFVFSDSILAAKEWLVCNSDSIPECPFSTQLQQELPDSLKEMKQASLH